MGKLNRLALFHRSTLCNSIATRESSSSFNIDEVTQNFEQRTEFAAANYRKNGSLFRMVLPPPNVTGKLHLGHALTVAVEDAICRHQRNQGNRAEWIPGFDHAGIATQVVVEKMLSKTGRHRQNMSREEFLEECQNWSKKCSDEIRHQLTRMGASLDWTQSYYTLDPKFSEAVTRAFCQLEQEGLITRGKRMVHWCPALGSTLSAQEVNRVDVDVNSVLNIPSPSSGLKRQVRFGRMHLIRYKLLHSTSEFIEVGTTRLETLFADVAIAVHPDDPRYTKFHGKQVWSPIAPGRKLQVITDSAVSVEKGTGAVKITPTHDPLDYEIWTRWKSKNPDQTYHIEEISCIDEHGKMKNCSLNGVDRFEARKIILERLVTSGDYKGLIKHEGAQVNVCSRTGDVIEPRLAEQWFLDCKEMFERSAEAIRKGKIEVSPEYQSHRLIDWFENQEPWCLSRQLWWGHRIPAYRALGQNNWLVTPNEQEAREKLGPHVRQDQDVLDTWFSSSLVPLVKNGWLEGQPIQSPSLNVMETGWDISGFWVARMIALNLKLSGDAPFGKVVLHGLVRDNEGRKMSKSLGNVIDPLDVLDGITYEKMVQRVQKSALEPQEIENAVKDLTKRFPQGISRCGPDALRFALLKYDVLSTDIPLDVSNVALDGLHFCNKLWNLAAYYEQLAEKSEVLKDVDSDRLVDEWIMARLSSTVSAVDAHMSKFALHLALSTLHKFITADICDVYLESTKKALWSNDIHRIRQARSTLQRVLQPTLVQLNAFMPFVSEHIYERIFKREPGSILFDVVKPSLFIFHRNEELENSMKLVTAVMAAVRSTRQKLQLSQKLIFSGILETNFSNLSPMELRKLADEVTQTCGLEFQKVCKSVDEDVKKDHMACPVPGHDAKLWLKIEPDSKPAFIESLKRQLEKTVTRLEQFEARVVSYEAICKNPNTKPLNLLKTQKKAENARKVVENAKEEAERIEQLISNQS